MTTITKLRILTVLFLWLDFWPGANGWPREGPRVPTPTSGTAGGVSPTGLGQVAHTISPDEVFTAIQRDLARRGNTERHKLRPGDLRIQALVPALPGGVGLQVARVGFDPIRRETVFELWASREPQYLPFEVTTQRELEIVGSSSGCSGKQGRAAGGLGTETPAKGQGKKWTQAQPPVLARPGKPAILVMQGQDVRIIMNVIPLQGGIRGQSILVRDPGTSRVMTAEVVGDDRLEASF